MPGHKAGTREEWKAAVDAVHEREQELGKLDEEIAKQRQEIPWVRVDKEYTFDTEDGRKTLPELFGGRSQLLIYQLMFGPTYEAACPGCTGLADHFDGALPHVNARDVTLIAISRAPIEKLQAYKQRMGWKFPYVSSFASDFNFDFDASFTQEQMATGESLGAFRTRSGAHRRAAVTGRAFLSLALSGYVEDGVASREFDLPQLAADAGQAQVRAPRGSP